MVRIIAPACPHCGGKGTLKIVGMSAKFKPTTKLDPIDINLAQWDVTLKCEFCNNISLKRINDVKAPLGYVEPEKVKE